MILRVKVQPSLPCGSAHPAVCLLLHSKAAVEDVQSRNLICILDVDIQGVRRIKETDLNPIFISIQPPSMETLVKASPTSSSQYFNSGQMASSRLFSIRKSV